MTKKLLSGPSTKFLGIHLDSQMKWVTHTMHVAKKNSSGLYALNSLKFQMPTHILRTIYHAMTQPHLRYGCLFWENTNKKQIHKLEVLQ